MGLARRRFAAWCATLPALAGRARAAHTADDLAVAERLRQRGLADTNAYTLVESLVSEIGARPAGSANDARAVDWALAQMRRLGFANVRAEPLAFRVWRRGAESARLIAPWPHPLVVAALGNSVATPPEGLEAELAYYPDLAALVADTSERARGRIAFVDQRMGRSQDGSGYGQAVMARINGAIEASRRGALALLIRSIGTDRDRFAHTGSMRYDPLLPKIPAAAVSVPDASLIARLQARGQPLRLRLLLQAQVVDATSANVIAEVPGADLTDEVVLLGAHLDSWDVGQGAVDDAAGVGIVVAAAKLLLDAGRRPRRTVRVVLFANEENGFDGARAYGDRYRGTVHQLVGESDFGAGVPWRLRSRVRPEGLSAIDAMSQLLAPLASPPAATRARPGLMRPFSCAAKVGRASS